MNDPADRRQDLARVGLCLSCRDATVVESDRGARFWRCERSRVDPAFAKFPTLPVRACSGYEPLPDDAPPAA